MKWASFFLVAVLCTVVLGRGALRISATSIRAEKKTEAKKKPVDAYAAFKLVAEEPQSDGGKAIERPIFLGGKFCPNDPSSKPTSSCLQPDVHVDRTVFYYYWALGHNDSNIMKPTVTVSNSTIMEARLLDNFEMLAAALYQFQEAIPDDER